MGEFVHLHLHSEYSLLDGACRIADLPERLRECGQNAVAITDHGNMYGVIDFYKTCKANGIKPIIGCEVYVAPSSRFDKRAGDAYYHLVLLCKNIVGYKNLIDLVSRGYTEGFYSKPRIDEELLFSRCEGLIALSACLSGKIPRLLAMGDYSAAKETAQKYAEVFGQGNYYIELQDHGTEETKALMPQLERLANECGLPMVATNDCHYLRRQDSEKQEVLMCIQTNTTIDSDNKPTFDVDDYYVKTTDEMKRIYSAYEGAIENSVKIAEMCELELEFDKVFLPKFPCPMEKSAEEYLRELTLAGLERRQKNGHLVFGNEAHNNEQAYHERIDYELSVINTMGYADYFLIVQDYVGFAKSAKIPVGPGRGSGAGSLVAYLLGITDIDSIKFDLLFERFLNPERVSMPDIDMDFCYNRRDEVIEYVARKYGREHVSQIITFGTLAAKAAIRDCGRAMGMSYSDVDVVAKAIPQELGITLKNALRFPELKELYESSEQIKKLVDTAISLEGMPRNISVHAAGVVITDKPVSEYVPLATSNGTIVTQFDMDTIASLGLLKFDFLALRYLTIINDAQLQIKENDPTFDIEKIPLDDKKTYELISAGDTSGVFQLESEGMKQVLQGLKPESIDDIISVIALYRPGPMDSIPRFIECRHDPSKVVYDLPELEPILRSTYGCTVYQEQVMSIFRTVAGYSYGHADIVRRAMSKKKASVLEAEREAFISGAVSNGIDGIKAEKLFDDITSFANYAFNKAHAAAYAVISYRSAYLKAHYTGEYMAALLTSVLGNQVKAAQYISECSRFKIAVLPPDVNGSRVNFATDGEGNIRYGLLALKNVGKQFIEAIISERTTGGRFESFESFVERMSAITELNKRQVEALIKCGAFDGLGLYRSQLLASYEDMIDNIQQKNRNNPAGQIDMFSLGAIAAPKFTYPDLPDFSMKEKLLLEKEASGMYFSGHMLDSYKNHIEDLDYVPISDTCEKEDGECLYRDRDKIKVVGIVSSLSVKSTKKDERMAFFTLEDKYGEIECIVFPKKYNELYHEIFVDAAVYVEGTVSIKDEENVKILVNDIIPLTENSRYQPKPQQVPSQAQATVQNNSTAPSTTEQTNTSAPSMINMYLSMYSANTATAISTAPVSSITNASPKAVEEHVVPQKIYLRVDDMQCETFMKAKNLVDIFNEGSIKVIFYDRSTSKYSEYSERMFYSEYAIKELKRIIGEDNVVIK